RIIHLVRPKKWTLKIRSSSCTLPARQANPKVWYILLRAIWCTQDTPFPMYSNINQGKSISVPQISDGSQDIATLSMGLCHKVLPHSCLKVCRPIQMQVVFGIS